jgi:hypothetical protein
LVIDADGVVPVLGGIAGGVHLHGPVGEAVYLVVVRLRYVVDKEATVPLEDIGTYKEGAWCSGE